MRDRIRRASTGFTLIELMVVVAIIGLLAAIAIPNYVAMQLRSKRSELPTNLEGIRNAEQAYEQEWDNFTSCPSAPTSMPTKTQVAFGYTYGDNSAWDLLGWIADGKVRGQYRVTAADGSAVDRNFSASAVSDIDGDSRTAAFVGDRNTKVFMVTDNARY